ncbi:CHRNA7 [Mytilus coruscus]|uniref:CHRNA7 n=1 Tax=Mytilus coruscus TaxID=42192 RepID=A0A6J8EHW3_MYTCO|nr:CHRNA7 [Mytilus coruscus]
MYDNHVTLHQTLLKNYDPLVTPTKTGSGTVSVSMIMYLQNVERFDESAHTLCSLVSWDVYWKDAHMSWNETEYNGVNSLYMKASTVWMPDIFIINHAVEDQRLEWEDDILQVWSSGDVIWITMRKLDTICEVNVQAYPFDIQKCHIELEGWIHDIENVILSYTYSYDTPNSAWEVKSVSTSPYTE